MTWTAGRSSFQRAVASDTYLVLCHIYIVNINALVTSHTLWFVFFISSLLLFVLNPTISSFLNCILYIYCLFSFKQTHILFLQFSVHQFMFNFYLGFFIPLSLFKTISPSLPVQFPFSTFNRVPLRPLSFTFVTTLFILLQFTYLLYCIYIYWLYF